MYPDCCIRGNVKDPGKQHSASRKKLITKARLLVRESFANRARHSAGVQFFDGALSAQLA